jgi:hypothetical protein
MFDVNLKNVYVSRIAGHIFVTDGAGMYALSHKTGRYDFAEASEKELKII